MTFSEIIQQFYAEYRNKRTWIQFNQIKHRVLILELDEMETLDYWVEKTYKTTCVVFGVLSPYPAYLGFDFQRFFHPIFILLV